MSNTVEKKSTDMALSIINNQLTLVIHANNKFVGKLHPTSDATDEVGEMTRGILVLEDAIEVVLATVQTGSQQLSTMINATIVGLVEFDCDDIIVAAISSKSPYYTAYFQTMSGLHIGNS